MRKVNLQFSSTKQHQKIASIPVQKSRFFVPRYYYSMIKNEKKKMEKKIADEKTYLPLRNSQFSNQQLHQRFMQLKYEFSREETTQKMRKKPQKKIIRFFTQPNQSQSKRNKSDMIQLLRNGERRCFYHIPPKKLSKFKEDKIRQSPNNQLQDAATLVRTQPLSQMCKKTCQYDENSVLFNQLTGQKKISILINKERAYQEPLDASVFVFPKSLSKSYIDQSNRLNVLRKRKQEARDSRILAKNLKIKLNKLQL